MRLDGRRVIALATCIGLAAASSSGVRSGQDEMRRLLVTSTHDDGAEGTLRWAFETSNATAEAVRIEIGPTGPGPHVIVLTSPLPAIKGPVHIEASSWRERGEYVAIDGAGYLQDGGPEACPGLIPGQYGANVRTMTSPGLHLVDTHGVEIAGLDIRNFCIGILIHRSSGNVVRDSRIVGNRGGAGIMLTGDDGQGNETSGTTVQNKVLRNEFVDNGDGLELTRGAAFNLVADNVFRSTPANPEPSQGVEILWGHDNVVAGNHFEGYSDGLQVNWGNRNYIVGNTFTGNAFGLSLTGVGNTVDRNTVRGNRVGIALRPAEPSTVARLRRNAILDNGHRILRCHAGGSCNEQIAASGIVAGVPGLEHAEFVGSRGGGVKADPSRLHRICSEEPACQPAPNGGLQPPVLAEARLAGGRLFVSGTVRVPAAGRYVVEVFGNAGAGAGAGESFVGEVVVVADGRAATPFSASFADTGVPAAARSVTATVTSPEGGTSVFSDPVPVQGP